MRRIVLIVAALVAVWIVTRSNTASLPASNSTSVTAPVAVPAVLPTSTPTNTGARTANDNERDYGQAASTALASKGFRTRDRLDEHYAKHGGEFGGVSQAQYLRLAQTLRDAAVGGNILEIVRQSDGVVSRFDKKSGAFLAFDRDGTIRTFFKPNDGERYFRRQANRPPSP